MRPERFYFLTQVTANRRNETNMPGVKVHEGESIDKALKQFKKQCEKSGILTEIKKREYYEKPSVKRKRKILAAHKKRMRAQNR